MTLEATHQVVFVELDVGDLEGTILTVIIKVSLLFEIRANFLLHFWFLKVRQLVWHTRTAKTTLRRLRGVMKEQRRKRGTQSK